MKKKTIKQTVRSFARKFRKILLKQWKIENLN